jgi:catechol 2,3-dioxygenase-like lactoylglutathione lyase family enzyme
MNTITNFRIKKMSPQFLVADLERSIQFYTRQLNFDIDFRYEDFYAGIVKDNCSIHLKSVESAGEQEKRKKNTDHLDIVFSVDDIEHLYEAFSNKPIKFVQPLRDMPYGKEFYVADPDGYVIAFIAET